MKKFILPVLFMVIAYFTAPLISPDIAGASIFFLVALGLGIGIMLNLFVFKKNSHNVENDNKN